MAIAVPRFGEVYRDPTDGETVVVVGRLVETGSMYDCLLLRAPDGLIHEWQVGRQRVVEAAWLDRRYERIE